MRGTVLERFHVKYKVDKKTDCWFWTDRLTRLGYGQLRIKNKKISAHRLSWRIHFGEIPRKLFVCHKCDNPPCVNPKHLFLGTAQKNSQDRNNKGRHPRAFYKGFCQRGHKITEENLYYYKHKNRTEKCCKLCHKLRCYKYKTKKKDLKSSLPSSL